MRVHSKLAWVLWVLLPACGGGDDGAGDDKGNGGGSYAVGSGTLAGTVGGEPWTLVSAQTDSFLSEGEPDFWVDFYQDPATCEAGPSAYRHSVITFVPRTPGRYPLGLSRTATFVIEAGTGSTENLGATRGVIEVDSVTATEIQGGVHIEFDSENVISGHFTATVCPPP
jgi:hypothetical protein